MHHLRFGAQCALNASTRSDHDTHHWTSTSSNMDVIGGSHPTSAVNCKPDCNARCALSLFLLVSIQRYQGKRFLRTSDGRRTTRRLRVRRSSSAPCQIPSCGQRRVGLKRHEGLCSGCGRNAEKHVVPNFWIHQHSCLTRHVRADTPVCLFEHTWIICEAHFIPHRHPLFLLRCRVSLCTRRRSSSLELSVVCFHVLFRTQHQDAMNLPASAESRTEFDGHFHSRLCLKLKFHETLENLMECQVAIKTPSRENTKR